MKLKDIKIGYIVILKYVKNPECTFFVSTIWPNDLIIVDVYIQDKEKLSKYEKGLDYLTSTTSRLCDLHDDEKFLDILWQVSAKKKHWLKRICSIPVSIDVISDCYYEEFLCDNYRM